VIRRAVEVEVPWLGCKHQLRFANVNSFPMANPDSRTILARIADCRKLKLKSIPPNPVDAQCGRKQTSQMP
jgi:hypothetical protein